MTSAYHNFGVLLLFSASLGSAGPPVNCRTPLGVPCHLIQSEWSQWTFFERGITDIRHTSVQMTTAVNHDGSSYAETVYDASGRSYHAYTLYLARTDQVVKFFPADHAYSARAPLIWHDRPFRRSRDGDATCSTGIVHLGNDFQLDPAEPEMLGLRVVHWKRPLPNGGSDDVYLAPDLDCVALKHRMIRNNALHLPVWLSTQEATRIDWGEPSPALFSIPANYRRMEDPGLPGLLRYLRAQPR